jgi:hypothetical protein
MAIDPQDPNLGATPERAEELKRANIEGARFKATMEGLNSVFKDFAKNSKDALKADSEMLAQLDGMGKGFKKAVGLADRLKGFTLADLKNAKNRNAFQKALTEAQGDQARVAADMAILEETITDKLGQRRQLKKDIAADEAKQLAQQAESDQLLEAMLARSKNQESILEGIEKLEEKRKNLTGDQAEILQQQIDKAYEEFDILVETDNLADKAASKRLDELNKQLDATEEILRVNKELKSDLEGQVKAGIGVLKGARVYKKTIDETVSAAGELSNRIEEVNNATPAFIEAFEKFGDATSSIPIVGDIIRVMTGGISDASKKFKELKAEGKGAGRAIAQAFASVTFAGLITALGAFIKLAVDGAKKSSEAIVTLNKSVAGSMVNMSAQAGRVASAAGKYNVPLQEAAATIGGINEALGMSLDYTQETTNQAIKLTNKYGLGVDTTAKLVKLSAANKDTMTETVDAITAGVAQFNAMNGVSISTKAIFDDIAHASATTLNGIGKQPGAIAAAAAAARSLGMSMEDIRSAAETTTDFQASLTSEMQTEMMLGKQLNLNKLREAALTGDVKTQAEEMQRLVKENAGRIGNNVKLQEQFASTLGISRDQYNEMLKTQDAMSVLTGKSGAAEEANAKTRKMSQEEIAKSIESTTGKLTSLQNRIDKIQENMALGAKSFADDILKGFQDEGFIGGMKNAFQKSFDAIKDGFKDLFNGEIKGTSIGKLIGGLAVLGATGLVIKAGVGLGKSLFDGAKGLLGLGKKKGMDNVEVINGAAKVTMSGGGMGDMVDSLTKGLRPRNVKGLNFTKKLSNLFGGKKTIVGKQLRNLAAMFGKRSSMFKQVFNGMSKTFKLGGSKLFSGLSSSFKTGGPKVLSGLSKVFSGGGSKLFSGLSKVAGPVLGKVLAPLELAMGAFKGVNQVKDLTAEQKKEQGIREDMGTVEAGVLGALTGNANKGSAISEFVGIEKGSAGDEAMGIAASGARGAMVGAAIGSIIPGVGTAIGGAVGGAVGVVAEGFKVFSDPNSKLRQGISNFASNTWDKAKEIGSKVKETAKEVGSKIKDFAQGVGEKAMEFGAKAKEGIVNFATGVAEKATAFRDAAAEKISSFASSVGNGIMSFANTARDKAKAFAGAVGEKIGSIRGKISEFVEANGGLVGGIKAAAAGLASKASEWFGSKVQGLKDWWNGDATKTVTNEIKEAEIKKAVAPAVKMSADQSRKFTEALNTALAKGAEVTTKAVNQVGEVLESPLGENATAANNTLNELKRLKEEGDRQHQKELTELRNQTALLYEYITKPQKSVIKMNTFKVGQSLTTV